MASEPDYLPSQIRAWAAEHQQLFDLVVAELLVSGNWPEISDLTRELAREGRPTPLREIFWGMPKPLGFVDHNPERVRLSLFGLGLVEGARPLLDGFAGILRLAVERYPGPADQAVIRRTDLAANGIADAQSWCSARSSPGRRHFWAVFRVARGTIGSVRWTTRIVNYWDVQTPDDYLRIRASELRSNPQFAKGVVGSGPILTIASTTTQSWRSHQ